jgi:hypothetical protein
MNKYKQNRLKQKEADVLTEAEIAYNQARAAHQISMSAVACNAYLKGLKMCENHSSDRARELRTRLANGLGTLFLDTGNAEGASKIFKKYIEF